jgi:hypothetical protein
MKYGKMLKRLHRQSFTKKIVEKKTIERSLDGSPLEQPIEINKLVKVVSAKNNRISFRAFLKQLFSEGKFRKEIRLWANSKGFVKEINHNQF